MLPQYYFANQSPQFDVSFPEKLLKIVAILGYIFTLNLPNSVWRPGSTRTRWGAKALPQTP